MMLDHRNIQYEYKNIDHTDTHEIPYIDIDGKIYEGKETLLEIRKLK